MYQGVGIADREIAQRESIEEAEDGGVRADRERERENDDEGESRSPAIGARGVANVLPQRIQTGPARRIVIGLTRLDDSAEAAKCGISGFIWRHSSSDILGRGHFQVGFDFVLQPFVQRPSPKRGPDSIEPSAQGNHVRFSVGSMKRRDDLRGFGPFLGFGLQLLPPGAADRVIASRVDCYPTSPSSR